MKLQWSRLFVILTSSIPFQAVNMRNASDIFCLNEEGTDGMQMFSVAGNCPMRIKRRNQTREGESFEYSRHVTNPDQALGKGDDITEKLDPDAKPIPDECREMGTDMSENLDMQSSAHGDHSKDNELQFHKVSQPSGSKERVTSSTIMRNPLTGAGMEIKEHRKPKKGKNLNDKWMW